MNKPTLPEPSFHITGCTLASLADILLVVSTHAPCLEHLPKLCPLCEAEPRFLHAWGPFLPSLQ